MASITKTSIANAVAGIAVVASIGKGFISATFTEVDLMVLGTALGYLFGAASTTASKKTVA